MLLFCVWIHGPVSALADETAPAAEAPTAAATNTVAGLESNAAPCFNVETYVVAGSPRLSMNVVFPLLSKYTGTNVSLAELVKAATDLQAEYRREGHPLTSVAIATNQIVNGTATLNVFQAALPQIVVSGVRYSMLTNNLKIAAAQLTAVIPPPPASNAPPATTAARVIKAVRKPATPLTPEEMAKARAALFQKIAELAAQEKDTRIPVVSTNAGPRFSVRKYLISGNTILTPQTLDRVLTNIDGDFGTNVSFAGVETAMEQLQQAYRDRGYVTVAVHVPQQKLTNATVKLDVVEGRLAAINVVGNRYFSSNNVMRALPSLHTNLLLNSHVFEAELNRANANQDRQIYPVVGPGPTPGASELTLTVKDRLPLHAKVEFNNQNSPGTPGMRVNTSAVADNLWQREHALGVQYGFSPETDKLGNQWDFYDEPSVAYYSGFYRLPLGNPEPIGNVVANNPGSFGYNEATRQFRLPPSTGQPELNLYASRATIDTGVTTLSSGSLFNIPFVRQLNQETVQQGVTINELVGSQLSKPLPQFDSFHSTLSGGLDYKVYSQANYETNIFADTEYTKSSGGGLVARTSYDYISTPAAQEKMYYLPLEINYNASLNNFIGPAALGLGLSANLWYSSYTDYAGASTNQPNLEGVQSLRNITGSSESSGHWVILRPSYSQSLILPGDWVTTLRADGQWASEPLISTEQFGIGGVNSVRGYHEGEVFGDTGWHVSLEQQTPPHVVGTVYGNQPLTLRGSVYMDWATAYRIDPPAGIPGAVELWGAGFGFAASVGPHWQSRFLFSLPLIGTSLTPSGQPYFNFSLTGQF
jgi:hemolysin activation/secretion protein